MLAGDAELTSPGGQHVRRAAQAVTEALLRRGALARLLLESLVDTAAWVVALALAVATRFDFRLVAK